MTDYRVPVTIMERVAIAGLLTEWRKLESERDLALAQLAELVGALPRCEILRTSCARPATKWTQTTGFREYRCDEHAGGPLTNWRDASWAPLVRTLTAADGGRGEPA